MNDIKARVFLSCGQSNDEERDIARKIAENLMSLGFDVYIAVNELSLVGLKENIFRQLEISEYFLFIDFKREKLVTSKDENRGSLFSHQELAVASYLNLPVLAFQEDGMKKLDGLLGFVQFNCPTFSDRSLLVDQVVKQVKDKLVKGEWFPNWKNQLEIFIDDEPYKDVDKVNNVYFPSRFYHMAVRNRHISKPAINCYAYLNNVINLKTKEEIPLETSELKWKGYTFPNAIIAPQSVRKFDAFWISHDNLQQIKFNIFTDYTGYNISVVGEIDFGLTYSIISENFPPVKAKVIIHKGSTLEKIKFEIVD
jgi:hypothetical protein